MFVDRSVPRITQQWEGFEFLQGMLGNAVDAIQKAIDAGAFPKTSSPNVAMHMLWAALIGPAVVGIRHRLATGEDYDALARDVLNATIAGLQAGVATTFVSCKCPMKRESREHLSPLECVVMSRNRRLFAVHCRCGSHSWFVAARGRLRPVVDHRGSGA